MNAGYYRERSFDSFAADGIYEALTSVLNLSSTIEHGPPPDPEMFAAVPVCDQDMASSSITHCWWDREFDEEGRPLRSDLRATAHEIWDWACNTTRSRLGDSSATGELMDEAVAQASAYLDKYHVPLNTHSHLAGLMRRCFWFVLDRHANHLQRIELVGGNFELSNLAPDSSWSSQVESRVDYQKLIRQLSERARTILTLREAGYDWQEIGDALGTSPTALKKSFARELSALQDKLGTKKASK